MTSLLAGTVAHGARGGRGVSTSHHRRTSSGLSGTPRYSPELPGNGSHNTGDGHLFDRKVRRMWKDWMMHSFLQAVFNIYIIKHTFNMFVGELSYR